MKLHCFDNAGTVDGDFLCRVGDLNTSWLFGRRMS